MKKNAMEKKDVTLNMFSLNTEPTLTLILSI